LFLYFCPALSKQIHIALVGNPNSGKTSLFNALTGLNQKVGNFPGVTVDKKDGQCQLPNGSNVTIVDLPGTYSLYPKRADEWVAYNVLIGQDATVKPDMVLLVADASNLRRNLLFCSQILDLKVPVMLALTMQDLAANKGTHIDVPGLERELGLPVIPVNPRKNKGIPELKKALQNFTEHTPAPKKDFIDCHALAQLATSEVKHLYPNISEYAAVHYLINHDSFNFTELRQQEISEIKRHNAFNATKIQATEIMQRYARIKQILQHTVVEKDPLKKALVTEKIDKILLHRKWGYLILLGVLFLLFQSVFFVAQYPMDFIEAQCSNIAAWLTNTLPANWATNLFVNGIFAGLSGIIVFVPQIMILFGLITMLEDTGYMARISFLTDKLMRKIGLNGKSIMPLISGYACAVPAVMSARSIENKTERLITILVTPLLSCSARLPVYTILIALVVPNINYLGFISLQGLVMMFLYIFSTTIALLVASIFKIFIKSTERSFFILELPMYRAPRWGNVLNTMLEKAKIFVFDAGKVIMVISVVLWVLCNFGPNQKMNAIEQRYSQTATPTQTQTLQYKTEKLEASFAGYLGKAIEPAIKPLGYDWKIGIALITSFAAREVFVGTMATLYSANADESATLKQKMNAATWPNGARVYTLATGVSLLIFYMLAMQCMSTLAIVKRETKSWKWPIIQFIYMTGLAYVLSFVAYTIFR
jgi:ferrous iron transport protein B